MNGTTENKGTAYGWVNGRNDADKARISHILEEHLNGHHPTADEIIKKMPSGRAFFAVGELLYKGVENDIIKREKNGYYINEEMLPEVKAALGME